MHSTYPIFHPRAEAGGGFPLREACSAMHDPAQTLRDFSFADGQYLGHLAVGDYCLMDYRNWREECFRFEFRGIALIRSYGGGVSLCEATVATNSPLIDDARRVLAQDWATSGGPQGIPLVELSIVDDVPVFSIVFQEVRILGPLRPDDCLSLDAVHRWSEYGSQRSAGNEAREEAAPDQCDAQNREPNS